MNGCAELAQCHYEPIVKAKQCTSIIDAWLTLHDGKYVCPSTTTINLFTVVHARRAYAASQIAIAGVAEIGTQSAMLSCNEYTGDDTRKGHTFISSCVQACCCCCCRHVSVRWHIAQ
jgi:hypothetical protein